MLDRLLDRTEALIATARGLPPRGRGARAALGIGGRSSRWPRGSRAACAAAIRWRGRVKLGKGDFAAAFLTGISPRRPDRR